MAAEAHTDMAGTSQAMAHRVGRLFVLVLRPCSLPHPVDRQQRVAVFSAARTAAEAASTQRSRLCCSPQGEQQHQRCHCSAIDRHRQRCSKQASAQRIRSTGGDAQCAGNLKGHIHDSATAHSEEHQAHQKQQRGCQHPPGCHPRTAAATGAAGRSVDCRRVQIVVIYYNWSNIDWFYPHGVEVGKCARIVTAFCLAGGHHPCLPLLIHLIRYPLHCHDSTRRLADGVADRLAAGALLPTASSCSPRKVLTLALMQHSCNAH